jgi:hypothetical protein
LEPPFGLPHPPSTAPNRPERLNTRVQHSQDTPALEKNRGPDRAPNSNLTKLNGHTHTSRVVALFRTIRAIRYLCMYLSGGKNVLAIQKEVKNLMCAPGTTRATRRPTISPPRRHVTSPPSCFPREQDMWLARGNGVIGFPGTENQISSPSPQLTRLALLDLFGLG